MKTATYKLVNVHKKSIENTSLYLTVRGLINQEQELLRQSNSSLLQCHIAQLCQCQSKEPYLNWI